MSSVILLKIMLYFIPKNKNELQNAVDLWCESKEKAFNRYCHISIWDTSLIKDMSKLFKLKKNFNDNINNWDVSSVTNMRDMFHNARSFNQPLNSWDVSSVTDMYFMFGYAKSFDHPLNSWDISSVTNMNLMFLETDRIGYHYQVDLLNSWDISNVKDKLEMFEYEPFYE